MSQCHIPPPRRRRHDDGARDDDDAPSRRHGGGDAHVPPHRGDDDGHVPLPLHGEAWLLHPLHRLSSAPILAPNLPSLMFRYS